MTLEMARGLQATDPRDKLYSLSNLVNLGLEADYSMSCQKLYRNFAAAQIMRNNITVVLSYAGIAQRPVGALLPSWAPDWHYLSNLGAPVGLTLTMGHTFRANQAFPWFT